MTTATTNVPDQKSCPISRIDILPAGATTKSMKTMKKRQLSPAPNLVPTEVQCATVVGAGSEEYREQDDFRFLKTKNMLEREPNTEVP